MFPSLQKVTPVLTSPPRYGDRFPEAGLHPVTFSMLHRTSAPPAGYPLGPPPGSRFPPPVPPTSSLSMTPVRPSFTPIRIECTPSTHSSCTHSLSATLYIISLDHDRFGVCLGQALALFVAIFLQGERRIL